MIMKVIQYCHNRREDFRRGFQIGYDKEDCELEQGQANNSNRDK
jgi:hypothetical protein